MTANIEKVAAITLKVAHMKASVRFYRDVLGMEVLYGRPNASFSSLRIPGTEFPIINFRNGGSEQRVLSQAPIRQRRQDTQEKHRYWDHILRLHTSPSAFGERSQRL